MCDWYLSRKLRCICLKHRWNTRDNPSMYPSYLVLHTHRNCTLPFFSSSINQLVVVALYAGKAVTLGHFASVLKVCTALKFMAKILQPSIHGNDHSFATALHKTHASIIYAANLWLVASWTKSWLGVLLALSIPEKSVQSYNLYNKLYLFHTGTRLALTSQFYFSQSQARNLALLVLLRRLLKMLQSIQNVAPGTPKQCYWCLWTA